MLAFGATGLTGCWDSRPQASLVIGIRGHRPLLVVGIRGHRPHWSLGFGATKASLVVGIRGHRPLGWGRGCSGWRRSYRTGKAPQGTLMLPWEARGAGEDLVLFREPPCFKPRSGRDGCCVGRFGMPSSGNAAQSSASPSGARRSRSKI